MLTLRWWCFRFQWSGVDVVSATVISAFFFMLTMAGNIGLSWFLYKSVFAVSKWVGHPVEYFPFWLAVICFFFGVIILDMIHKNLSSIFLISCILITIISLVCG